MTIVLLLGWVALMSAMTVAVSMLVSRATRAEVAPEARTDVQAEAAGVPTAVPAPVAVLTPRSEPVAEATRRDAAVG